MRPFNEIYDEAYEATSQNRQDMKRLFTPDLSRDLNFNNKCRIMSQVQFLSTPKPQPFFIPPDAKRISLMSDPRWLTLEKQQGGDELMELRQRGKKWFVFRKKRITGSKLGNLCGSWDYLGMINTFLETYANGQQETADAIKLKLGVAKEEWCEEQISQERMEWGCKVEQHAMASLLSYFGPRFNAVFAEAVIMQINFTPAMIAVMRHQVEKVWNEHWDSQKHIWLYEFLATSPDGIIILPDGTRIAVEFKCPGSKRMHVFFKYVPEYYYLQNQAHMLATNTDSCIFGCWIPQGGLKSWLVKRDEKVILKALPLLMSLHRLGLRGQVPTEQWFNTFDYAGIRKMCAKPAVPIEYMGVLPCVYCSDIPEEEIPKEEIPKEEIPKEEIPKADMQ